jgi:hypothetical protein
VADGLLVRGGGFETVRVHSGNGRFAFSPFVVASENFET